MVKFGVEEFGWNDEAIGKERYDWKGTEIGREIWRQKERRVRRLDFGRLKGGKDGSRGEGLGGVRPG